MWEICEVDHSIVGEAHFVESSGSADVVEPSDLPQCDVIEMDCEGAELNILSNLEMSPEKMIIETHQTKSYSPYSSMDSLQSILVDRGYVVDTYKGPWVDGVFVARLE